MLMATSPHRCRRHRGIRVRQSALIIALHSRRSTHGARVTTPVAVSEFSYDDLWVYKGEVEISKVLKRLAVLRQRLLCPWCRARGEDGFSQREPSITVTWGIRT
jgi:hypothetical protein